MRVENNFSQYPVNNMENNADSHNNQNDRKAADSLVDTGVSMEISGLSSKMCKF